MESNQITKPSLYRQLLCFFHRKLHPTPLNHKFRFGLDSIPTWFGNNEYMLVEYHLTDTLNEKFPSITNTYCIIDNNCFKLRCNFGDSVILDAHKHIHVVHNNMTCGTCKCKRIS